MHHAAFDWVRQQVREHGPFAGTVVEFGSRDINGGVRELFADAACYIGVDVVDGPGVDVVSDAVRFAADHRVGGTGPTITADAVVCTEVFEHTVRWPRICESAWALLDCGGVFICTAAGPGRAMHSMYSEGAMRDGEWYENVDPDRLFVTLDRLFDLVCVDVRGTDVRAVGVRS